MKSEEDFYYYEKKMKSENSVQHLFYSKCL